MRLVAAGLGTATLLGLQDPVREDLDERIDHIAREAVADPACDSLTVAVAFGDDLYILEGWGTTRTELAAGDTRYRVGALGGATLSMTVLALAEAGHRRAPRDLGARRGHGPWPATLGSARTEPSAGHLSAAGLRRLERCGR